MPKLCHGIQASQINAEYDYSQFDPKTGVYALKYGSPRIYTPGFGCCKAAVMFDLHLREGEQHDLDQDRREVEKCIRDARNRFYSTMICFLNRTQFLCAPLVRILTDNGFRHIATSSNETGKHLHTFIWQYKNEPLPVDKSTTP